MQPLSRRKRLGYLALSFLLFLIIAPVTILYAKGYRLTEEFQITRTGGFYISVGHSGAQIYINDSLAKETGVFQKGALVQNLKPGSYKIKVVKKNLNSWEKELPVFKETVTEARAFLLPLEPEITEIMAFETKKEEPGTSTPLSKTTNIKNPQYALVTNLFGPKTIASSTGPKILNKLSATRESDKVMVRWLGEKDGQPIYFCREKECGDEIFVRTEENINSFYFFPGRDDLIVFQSTSGIFVAEIDDRSKQNIQPILKRPDLGLRVEENTIFIKEGKKFYFVTL